MSTIFECGENAALVGYLYGECESGERLAIERHLAHCAACTAELAALQSARAQLASWAPPESELGFQVVRASTIVGPEAANLRLASSERGATSPWYRRPLPVWAQAVAATVVFGVGLSLGIVRGTVPSTSVASSPPAATAGDAVVSAAELSAVEERLRAEIARMQAPAPEVTVTSTASEGELMARVRALIEESERRQQRELAMRTAQVMRDVDSQRQVDLAQIQRSFGQIEGLTGAEVREQRQLLDYLIRVSEQR